MKILFTNFHEQGGGGHDTYIHSLCLALATEHQLSVAAPASSELLKKIRTLYGIKTIPIQFKIRVNTLNQTLRALRTLRRLLRSEKYDVVHVNGSSDHTLIALASLGMKAKPRIIFTKHNSLPPKRSALLRCRYFTDAIIAVSESTKKLFPKELAIPVVVVRNGVDIDHFKPATDEQSLALRHRYNIAPETFVIGSISGTPFYKGWWLLLEAIAAIKSQLPQPTRIIIGGDPLSDEIKAQYVKKNGLQDMVIFTGWLTDVREAVALFDVGYVLSYEIETISFACRQMMAMGKPVMVSDHGGFPENITPDVDGWITKSKDIESIKECLLNIIANRAKLPQMSQQARQKAVEQFDLRQWVVETKAVYVNDGC